METPTDAELLNDDFLSGLFSPDEEDTSLVSVGGSSHLPSHPERGTNLWDPRLVLDLALAIEPVEEILPRYGLTPDMLDILSKTKAFRRELALMVREVREEGLTFARKAQFQAESYLEVLDQLVYGDTTPANIRLEAIRSTVKWGRLEPKEEKENTANNSQINIQINF